MNCIHEFPAVVGPPRHECEFGLFFGDDWTPAHLTGGKTNLYKEIAFALKGAEWRKPALVAVASKLVTSAGEHKPIEVKVPNSYEQKIGTNPWLAPMPASPLAKDPETLPLGGLPSSSVPPLPVAAEAPAVAPAQDEQSKNFSGRLLGFLSPQTVQSSSSPKTPPNPPATDALKA